MCYIVTDTPPHNCNTNTQCPCGFGLIVQYIGSKLCDVSLAGVCLNMSAKNYEAEKHLPKD